MIEFRAFKSKNGEIKRAWSRNCLESWGFWYYCLSYIGVCESIGFTDSSKEEKRTRKPAVLRPKNERDCRFVEKDRGNGQQGSVKCQYPGNCRRDEAGLRRSYSRKGTSVQTRLARIMGSRKRRSIRWWGMGGIERKRWSKILNVRGAGRISD